MSLKRILRNTRASRAALRSKYRKSFNACDGTDGVGKIIPEPFVSDFNAEDITHGFIFETITKFVGILAFIAAFAILAKALLNTNWSL